MPYEVGQRVKCNRSDRLGTIRKGPYFSTHDKQHKGPRRFYTVDFPNTVTINFDANHLAAYLRPAYTRRAYYRKGPSGTRVYVKASYIPAERA